MSIDEQVSPRAPSTSLAARAGRWSARHRKTAILGWLAFVIPATVLGGAVPRSDVPESQSGNGESKRGAMIVDAAGYPEEAREQVLVQGRRAAARASDPAVVAAIRDVVTRLERIESVSDVRSPLVARHRASTVSADGRSALVSFKLAGGDERTAEIVQEPLAAVAAAQAANRASASSSTATSR